MLLIVGTIAITVALILWLLDKLKLNPSGRYVLITGCDTGFGNALAKSLDNKGCHVFATCLTTKGVDDLKASCSERLRASIMDVSNSESIEKAFDEVKECLPNGAGKYWSIPQAFRPSINGTRSYNYDYALSAN